MQRFLILIGVAVVAAAMYVAASPASQQAKAPSAKQFNLLKKQVAALSKTVKSLNSGLKLAIDIESCYVTVNGNTITLNALPVSQFGTTSSGFVFGPPNSNTNQTARSALDVNAASPSEDLQEVDPSCTSSSGLTHRTGRAGVSRLRALITHNR